MDGSTAKRHVHWAGQAAGVMEKLLPEDFADVNVPLLYEVQSQATQMAHFLERAGRRGKKLMVVSGNKRILVTFRADRQEVVGTSIAVLYVGGSDWEDPLKRYP